MTETFALIAEQRRSLADLMDGLHDQQWATPSLCAGWTVRDVAGHLTMPFNAGKASVMFRIIVARGNIPKVWDTYAKEAATAPTATLVETLRANADNHFTPPGLGPQAPLTDTVVHGLDIGMPTGSTPPVSDEAMASVLDFLVSPKATRGFVAKGSTTGLRFECTDLEWTSGSGSSVTGPAASLALALTGRSAGLESLTGDGTGLLRTRMA